MAAQELKRLRANELTEEDLKQVSGGEGVDERKLIDTPSCCPKCGSNQIFCYKALIGHWKCEKCGHEWTMYK